MKRRQMFVVQENRGTCKGCGQERDLREGYCFPCAPADVVQRLMGAIKQADVVLVVVDEPSSQRGKPS